MILDFQNALLDASPRLYPLLGLLYSAASSWHCGMMCSPLIPQKKKHSYYLGRLISYTIAGGVFGLLGSTLKDSLSVQLLAAVAFVVFAFATVVIAVSYIVPIPHEFLARFQSKGSALSRGLLSVFIPCHLLLFFFALAVVSGTWVGGMIILFGHAVISMPALAYSRKGIEYVGRKLHLGKGALRGVILLICAVNLLYFGSRVFYSEEQAKSQILFCW